MGRRPVAGNQPGVVTIRGWDPPRLVTAAGLVTTPSARAPPLLNQEGSR
jgi:hypothetical protein